MHIAQNIKRILPWSIGQNFYDKKWSENAKAQFAQSSKNLWN